MTVDMAVRFGALSLRNPVLCASGTFGYGQELAELTNLAALGGIATKGISLRPRPGNPAPRICETAAGMINSIGLENVGLAGFIEEKLPFLRRCGTRVVANFFGETFDEYVECAAGLTAAAREGGGIDAVEMNISCPNVKNGGVEFGTDPRIAGELVRACRKVTSLPLWVKLTPNVTDVVAVARAVVAAGADGLSLINTLSAMAIDARRRKPRIAAVLGGLSGPAIKPVALRMVFQVARAGLGVPICGIGGIASGEDAAEFLVAGATAVQVGTQTFVNPDAGCLVARQLEAFCVAEGISSVAELIGSLSELTATKRDGNTSPLQQ